MSAQGRQHLLKLSRILLYILTISLMHTGLVRGINYAPYLAIRLVKLLRLEILLHLKKGGLLLLLIKLLALTVKLKWKLLLLLLLELCEEKVIRCALP